METNSKSANEVKSVIGESYALFAIFSIINYLIPLFFIFPKKGAAHDWTLNIHLLSSFLCVGLLFFDFIPAEAKILKKYYGNFSLCFCLPFFSSVMFLHQPMLFWCTGLCLSTFLLAILFECRSFIRIFCLGVVFAFFAVFIFDGFEIFNLWKIIYLSYVSIFSLAVGIVFARKKEENNRKIIENLRILSATIAHEMRTPLTTISIASQNFEKYFGPILSQYKKIKIKEPNYNIGIDDRVLEYLENAPGDMYRISRKNLQLIDMLLKNFKSIYGLDKLELCSAKDCVLKAIDEYAFQKDEKQLVSLDEFIDFKFAGDEILFVHVIFNLISNSLRYINFAGKGQIKLWTSQNSGGNIVHFYDSAFGVNKNIIKNIFLPFTSGSKYDGTGLGLSFCRDVVEKFNGTIECCSDGDSFTEFQIWLPKVKQ